MRSRLLHFFLLAVFALACGAQEAEPLSQEKKALIDELLTMTGANNFSTTMRDFYIERMASVLRKMNPEIDPSAFRIIEEEVRAVMSEALADDALNELTYPIYHRHLAQDDIRALVEFYRTPSGRRVLAALPLITEEGMRAGQTWGAQLAPKMESRVLQRLKEAGILE